MTVGKICVREVEIVPKHETLQVAAAQMRDRNVGALVVLDDGQEPLGILTDRDVTIRVVADGLDCRQMKVCDVMTELPYSIEEGTPIEDALARMRRGPYRRLPVVNRNRQLVGLLTLDDILDLLSEEFSTIRGILAAEAPTH
ncbi:MAG: CBS domain-containing protein [Planctomycetaceae bacterium]|nr:CBS domain-containing protein [Planctomycetaceae bacterium]